MAIDNLDMKCAEAGRKVQAEEKAINSALAVLQHDGVYAFSLYVKAQWKEKEVALSNICKKLLQDAGLPQDYSNQNSDLYKCLDDIFLAKDLLERMLIYARYHVKANPEGA